ncbi:hypothetical protein [Brassicibacter mesophilus]|uniref:hypothetical protein n=1 Tax=Brassicibacter mesophilus TaxID=745119 RepID=UPI003D263741
MKKVKFVRLLILTVIILNLCVSCKNKNTESDLLCREMYFQQINDDITSENYKKGFNYSYYYNLDAKYEIRFELVLLKGGIEIDKVELMDIKEDIGYIDGTFGILVERDKENNKITWTIRHDEKTKQLVSEDFFKNIVGQHGSFSSSGLIYKEGVPVLMNEYDIGTSENGDKQYEWSVVFRVFGDKVNVDNP